MNNNTQLEAIKAKIEAMKAEKAKNVTVPTINLEEVKKDIHVSVSPAQITMYVKLSTEKRVPMNPLYRTWDGRKGGEMDKAIQALIKLPTIKAPSPAQIELLTEMCERNGWEVPSYLHLTGGRDGSMSKLINDLVALERETQRLAPPTEKQIETILDMYWCPEVDFADLHEAYALQYVNVDKNGQVQGAKLLWTRPSQEAVKTTIEELITFDMASQFIYKYQLEFFKWSKNRCSASQMEKIKRLQESCKMQPMEDYQLMQFDRVTADKYITNLNLVRRDADLVKFAQEPCIDDIDRTDTIAKARDKDEERKEGLLHSLYAMMGMNGNEESETSIDLSNNDEIIADLAKVCIELCGSDAVFSLLNEVYDEKEMGELLAIMYPKSENTIDINNMSIEELEEYMASITA